MKTTLSIWNRFENWFDKHCGWFFENGYKYHNRINASGDRSNLSDDRNYK